MVVRNAHKIARYSAKNLAQDVYEGKTKYWPTRNALEAEAKFRLKLLFKGEFGDTAWAHYNQFVTVLRRLNEEAKKAKRNGGDGGNGNGSDEKRAKGFKTLPSTTETTEASDDDAQQAKSPSPKRRWHKRNIPPKDGKHNGRRQQPDA